MASPAADDKVVDTPPWGQRLAGLMQVDVMQAVSYLRSLPEVDPASILTVGYLMCAFITGITGDSDIRLHAVLPRGGSIFGGPHAFTTRASFPVSRHRGEHWASSVTILPFFTH